MPLRFAPFVAGGYIPPGIGLPGAPTTPFATAGNGTASLVCSATSTGGSPVTLFTATSSPGNVVATSATGTINYPAASLTNGTPYTFTVTCSNALGMSPASAASNSVTPAGATVPVAPTIGTATAGDTTASVAFTINGNGGSAITGFTATGGGKTGTGLTSPIQVTGLTNGVPATFTVHATNAIGNSVESAASNSVTPVASANYTMYSNGVMDTVNWPDAQNVSFGCAQTYGYTTNPKPGHTKSLQLVFNTAFGGGWQRSSNWGNIPPAGFDASPYTRVKFSILAPAKTGLYLSQHYTRSTGDDISTSTSVTQNSTSLAAITLNVWTDVTVFLSSLGGLSSFNMYKCNLPGNNVAMTCQIDDVIYLAGNMGWIFRGRLTGLESGWTDASTAAANYAFLPQSLGSDCYSINNPPAKASVFTGSVTSGTLTITALTSGTPAIGDAIFYDSAVKGTLTGGSGLSWTVTGSPGNRASTVMGSAPPALSIPAVKMTPTGANQLWKATHAGFSLVPYTYFTIGFIPTNAASTFKVQFYNTSGVAVGSLLLASTVYTEHNFGTGTTWTVYNMPLSDFGAIGSTIGGISVQESAGSAWHQSAIGVFS